jgi:protein-S-isoprenylcysteine O-methyltransferase Ste14
MSARAAFEIEYAAGPSAFVTFVHVYEEPVLTRWFGAEYEAYRRAVPAWWPRLRPWVPRDVDRQ